MLGLHGQLLPHDLPPLDDRYDSDSNDEDIEIRPTRTVPPPNLFPIALDHHHTDNESSNQINPNPMTMINLSPHNSESQPDDTSTQVQERSKRIQRRHNLNPSQTVHTTDMLPQPGCYQMPQRSPQDQEHDNYCIGDTLSLPKSPNTTRLYFQNVNGISLHMPGTWDTTALHIQDMEINMCLIAEHKLDTTQPSVLQRAYTTMLGKSLAQERSPSTPPLVQSKPLPCTNQGA